MNHFNTMFDIKSNGKTLKVISRQILCTHLILTCILKGVKAKNGYFLLYVVFLTNHQTIYIYSRHSLFFKSKDINKYWTCHSIVYTSFAGLFKYLVFRSITWITQKLWSILAFFQFNSIQFLDRFWFWNSVEPRESS